LTCETLRDMLRVAAVWTFLLEHMRAAMGYGQLVDS